MASLAPEIAEEEHYEAPDVVNHKVQILVDQINGSKHFIAFTGAGVSNSAGIAQMSILRDLPFSLCHFGPEQVSGVGNYYIQILAPEPSQHPFSTLYFLDSHGQIPSKSRNPDYDWIKQSQIDWFTHSSQALRKAREKEGEHKCPHLSLIFMHIPLPEYAKKDLMVRAGHRREPTEGPSFNSHFYDTLANEGVSAVGCGHDHVNDFCGFLPRQEYEEPREGGINPSQLGPWLCYGGGSGFGGYGSYDGTRYHRRTRVWELDTNVAEIKTWKRVKYSTKRIDELVIVEHGAIVAPTDNDLNSMVVPMEL